MSGSPAVDSEGRAVAVVSTEIFNPHLKGVLPPWFLDELERAELEPAPEKESLEEELAGLDQAIESLRGEEGVDEHVEQLENRKRNLLELRAGGAARLLLIPAPAGGFMGTN